MPVDGLNLFVTGATGFVGSHFVDAALAQGHRITAWVRPGTRSGLFEREDRVSFVDVPMGAGEGFAQLLPGHDAVVHFAWSSDPVRGWQDPLAEVESNLGMAVQLFEACCEAGVKKILFPSSGGTVYGHQEGPISEEAVPRPFNPYGIGKLTAEHFLAYYRQRAGIAADVFRIGNAYGPRQRTDKPQGVIARWMAQVVAGETIEVFGGAETYRDYIHVQDVAALMLLGLDDLTHSAVYNLGTGVGTSILELLELFKTAIPVPFEAHVAPRRDLDNTSCILDVSRLLARAPGFQFRKLADELGPTWQQLIDP